MRWSSSSISLKARVNIKSFRSPHFSQTIWPDEMVLRVLDEDAEDDLWPPGSQLAVHQEGAAGLPLPLPHPVLLSETGALIGWENNPVLWLDGWIVPKAISHQRIWHYGWRLVPTALIKWVHEFIWIAIKALIRWVSCTTGSNCTYVWIHCIEGSDSMDWIVSKALIGWMNCSYGMII